MKRFLLTMIIGGLLVMLLANTVSMLTMLIVLGAFILVSAATSFGGSPRGFTQRTNGLTYHEKSELREHIKNVTLGSANVNRGRDLSELFNMIYECEQRGEYNKDMLLAAFLVANYGRGTVAIAEDILRDAWRRAPAVTRWRVLAGLDHEERKLLKRILRG